MSAVQAPAAASARSAKASNRLAPRPVAPPPPPRLRIVPASVRRPARAPFLLLVAGLLASGLLALLMLNTLVAQDAFVVHDLEQQSAVLTDRQQALQQEVAVEASPERLAARARALGLVPSENPVFLRLSDGRVVGVPAPAKALPKPKPKPNAGTTAGAPKPGTAARVSNTATVGASAKPKVSSTAGATPTGSPR